MKQRSLYLLFARALLAMAIGATAFVRMPAALAIQTNGVARNVHYVAAFQPLNGGSIPFSAEMVLNYNNGIISGTYNDRSIQPNAPFANRTNVPVAGGVSGDNIHFSIGMTFSFNGKIEGDTISGSAYWRGRIYEFLARQGVPKHG